MTGARLSIAGGLSLLLACAEATPPAPAPAAWERIQEQRTKQLDDYLSENADAYRWFADFPFGTTVGTPFLILRVLPEIAPELWAGSDNFLADVGLFRDERAPAYPIARGVGWSGLARDDVNGAIDYASFTCGACHIGRARLNDGTIRYLDGGINSEFNLVAYRRSVVATIEKMIGGETDPEKRVGAATAAIVAAVDEVHARDPNFFYADYRDGNRHFDAAYEANQVRLFNEDAQSVIAAFLVRSDLELRSLAELIAKNYKGHEEVMLRGFGGMADATGISTSIAYIVNREIAQDPDASPERDLPPSPGLTDFMAVWEQSKRRVSWSADGKRLVDGGGQWNGNIPIPLFRNLAAALTLGYGEKTDVRIVVFARDLLDGLPAPPYPFEVDLRLAERGKSLFEANCAGCHRPHNGNVYDIGTDLGRALVVSEHIAAKARSGFTAIAAADRVVDMPGQGQVTPFAEFEGVSLAGKPEYAMMAPKDHRGYNALPLGGIWAQSPYLHNGSVATLYHLLLPNERPESFIKSRLDYDTRYVGYSWQPDDAKAKPGEGYVFDTTLFSAVSRKGHDQDVSADGVSYKLDWSDDRAGAMAIIEYLKTL